MEPSTKEEMESRVKAELELCSIALIECGRITCAVIRELDCPDTANYTSIFEVVVDTVVKRLGWNNGQQRDILGAIASAAGNAGSGVSSDELEFGRIAID